MGPAAVIVERMSQLQLHRATIRFDRPRLDQIEQTVAAGFAAQAGLFRGKKRVAVAVGSRGIANLAQVVRASITALRRLGCEPFIFPAMGSHGGATAEGQAELLASFGVTEAAMSCPIRSSMETVPMDSTGLEHRLFLDRVAAEADGILVINRIKVHTDFHGLYESGLAKMAVIGLGKEAQALEMHQFGVRGLRELLPRAAERILASGRVLAGLAIVENAYDETALIELLPATEIMAREPGLLEIARRNMPRLPLDEFDVLIVDEIGKNISGAGLDTNIIGRIRIPGEPEPAAPRIGAILLDDLTEESHGNAVGIGLADVVTRQLAGKIDFAVTNRNVITSSFLERGKLPVVAETAAEGYALALRSCHILDPEKARVIRIRNTLHLGEVLVSAAAARELQGAAEVSLLPEPLAQFTSEGRLQPWPE